MYKCEVTGKMSKPGAKLHKVVASTREREYKMKLFNEETRKYEDVVVGHGWEIVRELNASEEGEAIWNSMTPDDRAVWLKRFKY